MTTFVGNLYDDKYLSLVGWEATAEGADSGYHYFWSKENMDFISGEITRQLRQFGLNICATPEVIAGAMSGIARAQNPVLGDIFTRYNIPKDPPRNDAKSMTEQVINVIINQILGEQQQGCCSSQLSIWSTVKGDFSPWGIRSYFSHKGARIRSNDYIKGVFVENY